MDNKELCLMEKCEKFNRTSFCDAHCIINDVYYKLEYTMIPDLDWVSYKFKACADCRKNGDNK